jgi:hypothetical protein
MKSCFSPANVRAAIAVFGIALILVQTGCQTPGVAAGGKPRIQTEAIDIVLDVSDGPPPSIRAKKGLRPLQVVTPGDEQSFRITLPASAPDASLTINLRAYKGTVVSTTNGNVSLSVSSTPVTAWFASGSSFDGNDSINLTRGTETTVDFELDSEYFTEEEIQDTHLVILGKATVTDGNGTRTYTAAHVFDVDSPYAP